MGNRTDWQTDRRTEGEAGGRTDRQAISRKISLFKIFLLFFSISAFRMSAFRAIRRFLRKQNPNTKCKWGSVVNIVDCWHRVQPGRTRRRWAAAAATGAGWVVGQGQAWHFFGSRLSRAPVNPLALCGSTHYRASCAIDFACTAHLSCTAHCAPGLVDLLPSAHLPIHSSLLSAISDLKHQGASWRNSCSIQSTRAFHFVCPQIKLSSSISPSKQPLMFSPFIILLL